MILPAVMLFTVSLQTMAQCWSENKAFKSGEALSYDLYYNWKFIWVKAGTATMTTVATHHNGSPAFRTSLITRGNHRIDDFFVLRDTLLGIVASNLTPLYFRKGAREGSRYTVDEVNYSYSGGKVRLRQHYINKRGEHQYRSYESHNCIFDMISMLLRARSFDGSDFKKGHTIYLPLAFGKSVEHSQLIYRGKAKFKMNNGSIFRCMVFSYVENDDGEKKEVIKFYVTDDDNHLPVRLDMNLKFGVAKAYLSGYTNLRNPITAKVR